MPHAFPKLIATIRRFEVGRETHPAESPLQLIAQRGGSIVGGVSAQRELAADQLVTTVIVGGLELSMSGMRNR